MGRGFNRRAAGFSAIDFHLPAFQGVAQDRQVYWIVFHHQDHWAGAGPERYGSRLRSRLAQRQSNREGGTYAVRTLDRDPSTHQRSQFSRQRETQTQARIISRKPAVHLAEG